MSTIEIDDEYIIDEYIIDELKGESEKRNEVRIPVPFPLEKPVDNLDSGEEKRGVVILEI